LQALEPLIFSTPDADRKKALLSGFESAKILTGRLRLLSTTEYADERNYLRLLHRNLLRLFLTGLTQMETPVSRIAFMESASVLEEQAARLGKLSRPESEQLRQELDRFCETLRKAASTLRRVNTRDPDYFRLYTECFIPLSDAYSRYLILRFPDWTSLDAVNPVVRSVFDRDAFRTDAFMPGTHEGDHRLQAELGRMLFFDPALSSNNERSCASCHQPAKAFTDGQLTSHGMQHGSVLRRNAPTVINAVLQQSLFFDLRVVNPENQAGEVLNNSSEMHGDASVVADKLQASPGYRELFRKAFDGSEDTLISPAAIVRAIAEYERTLIALNAEFDQAMRGEVQLSPDAYAGFNLFMGKGRCASCHFLPLFNGTVPPEFRESEAEILNVPATADPVHPRTDEDPGRAAFLDLQGFKAAFKTPSLRNITLTAPYMHQGVFETLEEVIAFYNRGGGAGLGIVHPEQTLDPEPLHLTPEEEKQLIAFLNTLTDTSGTTRLPDSLPSFPDEPRLRNRTLGGDY
jgi:cytochrome c peroxidase